MSDLPHTIDREVTEAEMSDFIDRAIALTEDKFGPIATTERIRDVLEICDNKFRYIKLGRSVVRSSGAVYSTIELVIFEPDDRMPTSESDDESLILMRTAGHMTSYRIDVDDRKVDVSRGIGELTINAIGEVELEIIDWLYLSEDPEEDQDLGGLLLPDSLFVSDMFLLLDACKFAVGQ
ncbi:hypothetical protein KC878_00550 [Candidatus Saccharibacteria bacterium]|nr:hypothetical protein [Candidatus Saccharibacteria bacterium]MCB9821462.1 hypothetical protein [Candidatus Nomurabacteria bacterium]